MQWSIDGLFTGEAPKLKEKERTLIYDNGTLYESILNIGTYKKGDNVTIIYGGGYYDTIDRTWYEKTTSLEVFIDGKLTLTNTYSANIEDDDTTYSFTIP